MLERALSILDRFAERDEWPFMELCQAVGLHKSTVFRIISTLEAAAYLEKRPATGRYRPGPKLGRLEAMLLRTQPLRWAALPPLQDLARRTGETAHIGVLYQGEAVTVEIVEGTHSVRMHSSVGRRAPAHASALGKAILAYVSEAERDELIDRFGLPALTARTITDPARLRKHLRDVRRRGFAVDDEELEAGLRCIAVPLLDAAGRPRAAMSISGPASRLAASRDEERVRVLHQMARRTAAMLGRRAGEGRAGG